MSWSWGHGPTPGFTLADRRQGNRCGSQEARPKSRDLDWNMALPAPLSELRQMQVPLFWASMTWPGKEKEWLRE